MMKTKLSFFRSAAAAERGIALVTSLLVLMLMSVLLVGFTTVIMTDQRYRIIDKDRGQAFYAASGAIEKLTVDLGNTFLKNVAPTNAQITALTASTSQPVISNVTYTATSAPQALAGSQLSTSDCNNVDGVNRTPVTVGANGYTIMFCALAANNNPTTLPGYNIVQTGTYAGLMALKTPYQLDVTSKTSFGGEVHLIRTMEAVSIPVFQFGIFSDVDLAFNAADTFAFGGRVHTNGNLFLAQGNGTTLTLSDKVTAVKEVVRANLSNGNTIESNSDTGTVNMTKGGGAYRALAESEGSVVAGPSSSQNEPTWHTISLSTYKGYIQNGRTGAKQLNLPIIVAGGANTDLVRRPLAGEDTTSIVYNERLFNKASIRVLLSDTTVDITNIPGVDNTAPPLSLEAGNTYGGIPIAVSPSPGASAAPVTTITAAVTAGTNKTITTAATPAYFALPATINVSSGANAWTLTLCTAKTATTFVCTLTTTAGGVNTVPVGSTVKIGAGALPSTTVTAASTPAGVGAGRTITVSSTMGFAYNTFWVNDQVVTCSGYTATTLTGCTVGTNIAAGDKIQNFSTMNAGTSLVGGFIKVERQNAADSTWHDITPEILGYGIGAPSQAGSCTGTDPSPNAIVRLQRLSDDAFAAPCLLTLRPTLSTDYWPNTLFDSREAWQRESGAPAGNNIKLGGVMFYVQIDAANLARWFTNTAPYAAGTGNQSKLDNGGFSIYISDRRNNRDTNSKETAEFGYEDFVNPTSGTGTPNNALDAGEDVNANGTLEVYGGVPNCNGKYNVLVNNGITCAATFFTTAFAPLSDLTAAGETFHGTGRAMVNRPIMFRRAVKLVNGSSIGTWVIGLTVVTENPVYVQGDWNAPGSGFNDPHAASAVIGDAVTVLSNAWNDPESFASLYAADNKPRSANSYYRMAVLAGKGPIFPNISGAPATFGTDGGAHSFLRFLEGNGANPDAIRYRGSMATFYYNRQAVGVFKGVQDFVYGIPALRDYAFDTDFQNPSKLPPLTPMFRDMDAIGFSQQLQPGK